MNFSTENTLLDTLGIKLTGLDKNKVVASMPVDGRTHQIAGVLHGGASAALLETVASIGSCLNIDMQKQEAFGIELNISHLKSIADGSVIAEAIPERLGRTLHVWQVKIFDSSDTKKIIAAGRCTVFVRSKS